MFSKNCGPNGKNYDRANYSQHDARGVNTCYTAAVDGFPDVATDYCANNTKKYRGNHTARLFTRDKKFGNGPGDKTENNPS